MGIHETLLKEDTFQDERDVLDDRVGLHSFLIPRYCSRKTGRVHRDVDIVVVKAQLGDRNCCVENRLDVRG